MSDHPEGPPSWEEEGDSEAARPVHGQVRHSNISARVPEDVGNGVFSNGVMILRGAFEVVLDFVLRMGERNRIVSRVILPHSVGGQFAAALKENIRNYEQRFGPLAKMPRPRQEPPPAQDFQSGTAPVQETPGESPPPPAATQHPENQPVAPAPQQIEDIYDDLKLPDDALSGHYANAVLIRHSGTEFCFDFITNLYPRSAVSARVFLAAPHVGPFLNSLQRSLQPPELPGTSQDIA